MDNSLEAFYVVAKNKSFTKAAKELFISQPAISKHISKLEHHYQVRLFERQGNTIELTLAGQTMLKHCEKIFAEYQQLEYDMHLINNEHVGKLELGASTTISQYLLPPKLATFLEFFPKVDLSLINGNSKEIELALMSHNIELGLIEGLSRTPTLSYTPFFTDELVVVTGAKNKLAQQYGDINHLNYLNYHDYPKFYNYQNYHNLHKEPQTSTPQGKLKTIDLTMLKTLPFVMRERGSGTFEVIEKHLQQHKLKLSELNICIYLGSTEAIKLFVQNSESICILSKIAIQKELANGDLCILRVKDFSIKRDLCLVTAPGPQSPLLSRFISFMQNLEVETNSSISS